MQEGGCQLLGREPWIKISVIAIIVGPQYNVADKNDIDNYES